MFLFWIETRDSILDDVIYIDGEKDGVPVEVAMVYNTSYTENVILMSIILIPMKEGHIFQDLEEDLHVLLKNMRMVQDLLKKV